MNEHDNWWMTKAQYFDLSDKNLKLQECLDVLIPAIGPALKAGSIIMDFGCGIGRLAIPLVKHFNDANLMGIDISDTFREDAIREAIKSSVSERCYFMAKIDTKLKVDAAYSMLVFQHMPSDMKQNYFSQIARSLNRGGIFCFQYVEGESDTFLTHDAKEADITLWLRRVGFEIDAIKHNLIEDRWTWVKAIKT